MSTPVLEIQGVTKQFDDKHVLQGIDLKVAEHTAVVMIGASGSGKSTLLRCINLLVDIDDGDILLDGEVVTDPTRMSAPDSMRTSPAAVIAPSKRSTPWPLLMTTEPAACRSTVPPAPCARTSPNCPKAASSADDKVTEPDTLRTGASITSLASVDSTLSPACSST